MGSKRFANSEIVTEVVGVKKRLLNKIVIPVLAIILLFGLSLVILMNFIISSLAVKMTLNVSPVFLNSVVSESKTYLANNDYDSTQVYMGRLKDKEPIIKQIYYVDVSNKIICSTNRDVIEQTNKIFSTDDTDKVIWISKNEFYMVSKIAVEISEYLPSENKGYISIFYTTEYHQSNMNEIILISGISIGIIAIVIVLFLILFIRLIVIKPIKKITGVLSEIFEDGVLNLNHKIEIKSDDEIGELGNYFNLAFEKIRNLVVLVKQQSSSLQNVGTDLSSNMSKTTVAINEIYQNIQSIKDQTISQSASVTETSATMEEITKRIEKLNHLIEDQSANVTESSAAIEEMMASIENVTLTLIKNNENINKLSESSQSGREDLNKIANDIQSVAKESEGLLEISKVIQNIASQTDLLAMNAA